jgi:hypothetical protein
MNPAIEALSSIASAAASGSAARITPIPNGMAARQSKANREVSVALRCVELRTGGKTVSTPLAIAQI